MPRNVQKNSKSKISQKWISWLIAPAILLVIWQIAAMRINQPWIFPTVSSVIEQLIHPFRIHYASGSLLSNTLVSLLRVLIGFILAAFQAG